MNVFKMTKKKAKFIAAFLCICLITGLSMNQAGLLQFAKADDAVWTGILPTATKALQGKGTASSPYYIDTAQDLAQFAYNVNNDMYSEGTFYFELRNDINLANHEWTPIGNQQSDFKGVFNGGGHTITGMKITVGATSTEHLGFFGRAWGAQIKNLKLLQASISQDGAQVGSLVGGIVGLAEASVISNCSVNNSAIVGNSSVGGIVGSTVGSSNSNITGCYIYNTSVKSTDKNVGGIAGHSKGGIFVNCYTRSGATGGGSVENLSTGETTPEYSVAGGIVGYSEGSVNVVNCYNNIPVKSNNIAGGIIAAGKTYNIRNSYNVGTVSVSEGRTTFGSICGSSTDTVVLDRCFYLKTGTEVAYPSAVNANASNIGNFADAKSSTYLVKESTTWNFTDNKNLMNALLEGVINYSTTYTDILQWGNDTTGGNGEYPVHTTVKGHIHDDKGGEVYSKYPTCTEDGVVEKHCSQCDYFQTIPVSKTGHSYENSVQPQIITKAPTCEEKGKACYVCTNKDKNNGDAVCGAKTQEVDVEALGHDMEAVTKAATCVDDGYTRLECQNGCGKVENEVPITKLGHDYIRTIRAATCTTPEYRVETCARCDDVIETPTGSALGHDWDNVDGVSKQSTCVEKGGMLRTCKRAECGYNEFVGEQFPYASHNYSTKKVPPTCTEPGYTVYTCDVCSVEYRNLNLLPENEYDDYVAPKGHTYGAEIVPPKCKDKGYTKHTCIDCDHTYNDADVDATGKHQYSIDTVNTKLPSCLIDGVTVKVCDVCQDTVRTVVPAIGEHDYVLLPERSVAQSCTAGGYDYYQCKVCLDSKKENVTEEGFGHSYVPTVTAPTCLDGGFTTNVCSTCNDSNVSDRVPALGHDYKETVVAATTTTRGYTVCECTRCDNSYECDYIAANTDASYDIATETLKLSDVDELMAYSLNGGTDWETVEVSSVAVSADAIDAEVGIHVKRPGNDVLPLSDSAIQIIQINRAPTPPEDTIISIPGSDDRPGMIAGVNSTMEYQMEGETEWHPITSEILEGLPAGTYYIRIKATADTLASLPFKIVVKGGSDVVTPPAGSPGIEESTGPGTTNVPGQSNAPGNTDVPGQSNVPGNTNKPGQTTAPGKTTVPSGTNGNNSSNNSSNSANTNSANKGNAVNNNAGTSNNNNSTGTANGSKVAGATQTPGVIANSVYYSSNGGASTGTKSSVSSLRAAKTGDDSNIVIWLVIAATSVCAVAITRKKRFEQ